MPIDCPVCGSPAEPYPIPDGDRFDCRRCGEFDLTGSVISGLQRKLDEGVHRRALMSHNLRRTHRAGNKVPLITTANVESFWRGERLPPPQQQADDLILWVGDNQLYPDEAIRCALPYLGAWIGASLAPPGPNSGGIHWLSTFLADEGLLRARPDDQSPDEVGHFQLTMAGWRKHTELKRTGASRSQVFVAMWFDESTEDMWTDGLQKGISDAGYDPLRINMKEHVNKICDEIIAEIRRSRFVVADYTGHRGGVYYEAGFAAGLGLTVIPTCRRDEIPKLHFDVRQYNCIDWQAPEELARRLQARIEAILGDGPRKT